MVDREASSTEWLPVLNCPQPTACITVVQHEDLCNMCNDSHPCGHTKPLTFRTVLLRLRPSFLRPFPVPPSSLLPRSSFLVSPPSSLLPPPSCLLPPSTFHFSQLQRQVELVLLETAEDALANCPCIVESVMLEHEYVRLIEEQTIEAWEAYEERGWSTEEKTIRDVSIQWPNPRPISQQHKAI